MKDGTYTTELDTLPKGSLTTLQDEGLGSCVWALSFHVALSAKLPVKAGRSTRAEINNRGSVTPI